MEMEAVPGLHNLVEQDISQHGDKLAVLYDTGISKEYVTYRQLWEMSSVVMEALSRYSVENEVVGLCLEQDKNIPAFILGVLRSGGAFYNFEAESGEFVSQVVQDIHVRILIVDNKFLSMLQQLILKFSGKITSYAIPACPRVVLIHLQLIDRKCHHSNLAYCITTSGTTGKPKVVQVPHCCIVPNIIHIRNIYNLTSDDLVLLCSPLTFDPSIVEMFTSLSVGACLLIVPHTVKVVPEMLLEVIHRRNKVTVTQCTPALLRRFNPVMVRETILGAASSLRVLSLGGEKFPSCTEIQKLRASGNQTKFFNLYGITEVSSWAMACQVTQFGSDDEVHLGFPLLDTEIKICDESGQTLSEGIGRIFLGGKTRQCIIGSGEENSYDVTVTRWRDTGDYGRITKDGYIYYIGREDSQVKRHGKRLNMEELNQVVKDLSFIRCCATQTIDNKLVVFIVINHSREDSIVTSDHSCLGDPSGGIMKKERIEKFVIDKIRNHLPGHYVPDDIVEITNLPITKHGKTDQNELAVIFRKRQTPQNGIAKPYECLIRAWKNFLCINCDRISDDSLFIQLGGDSLKAIQLVDKIEIELNCKFPKLLDLLLSKPFKVISDYIETVSQEETESLTLKSTEILEYENIKETLLSKASDENITEYNRITSEIKTDDLHGWIFPVNDSNERLMADKVASKNNDSDFVEKTNEVKETRVTGPDKPDNKTLDDKEECINSRSYATIETNEVKVSNYFDNISKTIYDKLQSSYHEDISNKDKSVFPAAEDEVASTSHKRSLVLSRGNLETKKKRLNERKRNFYKFIQRGNRIYDLSDDQSTLERLPTQVICTASHDLKSKVCSKMSHDPKWKSSICNSKKIGQLKVTMRERWRYNTGKCVDASPLLAITRDLDGGVVYIGSHSHRFCAISMATGCCIWEVTLGDRIESSACLSKCGNYVIVGCYDGNIYVLDSDTGDIFWQYQTGSEVKSSPAVDMATGLIYVGSHSQCLYALNIQARECAWKSNLRGGSIFSFPAVSYTPHHVYVGTLGGWLVAVSATSGETAWRYNLGRPVFSSPSISAYGVVVGCVDSYLYQFNYSGTLLWRFKTQGPIFSSQAVWNMSEKTPSFEPTKNQVSLKSDGDSAEHADFKGISKGVCSINVRKQGNLLISPANSASSCSVNVHESKQSHGSASSQMAKHSSETKKVVGEISDPSEKSSKPFNNSFDNDSLGNRCDSLDNKCYCSECRCDSVDCRVDSSDNYCDTRIIFGSHDTNVYCLTSNGNMVWQFETESPVYSTPFSDTIEVKHLRYDKSVNETDNYPNIRARPNDKEHVELGLKTESSQILYSVLTGSDRDKGTNSNKFCDCLNENNVNEADVKEHHAVLDKTENDKERDFRKLQCCKEKEKCQKENCDNLYIKVKTTLSNKTVYRTKLDETENYMKRDFRKLKCIKEGDKTCMEASGNLDSEDKKTFSNGLVDHTELNKAVKDEGKRENEEKSDFRKLLSIEEGEKICKEDSDIIDSEIKKTYNSADIPLVEVNATALSDPTLNVGSFDVVAFASTKGTLYLVGAKEGQVFCELKMRNEIFSSPILYKNSLVIGCRDDNVYCFDIEAIIEEKNNTN